MGLLKRLDPNHLQIGEVDMLEFKDNPRGIWDSITKNWPPEKRKEAWDRWLEHEKREEAKRVKAP